MSRKTTTKKRETIDLAIYAFILSYLFVLYEYLLQKYAPLGAFGDLLSLVFYVLFMFGIFSGLKIVFDKKSKRDKKYWTLALFEAVSLLFIFVTLFNIGNM